MAGARLAQGHTQSGGHRQVVAAAPSLLSWGDRGGESALCFCTFCAAAVLKTSLICFCFAHPNSEMIPDHFRAWRR